MTTVATLRRYAIARSLFAPTTLLSAITRLGFVQADPIRAPARAQDLVLRQRVLHYRAGDLENIYPRLPLEEDFFVNYGFLLREHQALMHPRVPRTRWSPQRWAQARAVLDFVRERGAAHPSEVDAHFDHGRTRNWFGGSSRKSTQLLDGMHYRGLLRIARRDSGVRVYAAREPTPGCESKEERHARIDALVDLAVRKYAPLPGASLGELVSHLRGGIPQWRGERAATLKRAWARLAQATIGGVTWYWPAEEAPQQFADLMDDEVRLLAPFDPVVWDRRRFELFWGWAYRFEAYTPPAKRKLGYYALPLLWRDRVIGWGNVKTIDGALSCEFGYVQGGVPRTRAFRSALEQEIERMRNFLNSDRQ
jgi:uncharacterized protein YcaQ